MSANFHSFPHNTIKKVENISNEEYDKIEKAPNLNWKPVDKAFGAEVLQKSTFPKTTLTVFGAFFLIAVFFGIVTDSLADAVTCMALFMLIPLIISYICEKVWRNGDNKKFRSEKSDYVLLEIDHIKRRLFWKYAVIYIKSGKHICRVHDMYVKNYEGAKLVEVMPLMSLEEQKKFFLASNTLSGVNKLQIFVFGNDEQILLAARLDNLGKGASGAAVQCLNIMMGIEETTGLV